MALDADYVLVLCTAPTADVATELARGLVAEKLAACVNFFAQVSSVYTWKGVLEQQQEVQLLIKTRRERYADVERWLVEHHPYEVPEVVAIPIQAGSAQYLAWLREQTQ